MYVRCVRGGQSQSRSLVLTIDAYDPSDGVVTSEPAGIDCGLSYTACSADFSPNQVVTLSAVPTSGGYIFLGWSGDPDCTDGIVTMSADAYCTAIFDLCDSASMAMTNASGPFSSITAAYAGAASTDTIRVVASNQEENPVFSGKDITLQGGYDCAFTEPPASSTTITGTFTISGGSVTIGEGEIQIE